MASLRKRRRSPFWFACFTRPDGSRAQRTTKTRDRKLAMRLAIQWEDAARRRITEAQARRVLSDIHEQIHGDRLATPNASDYTAQWLVRKQGETAAVTMAAYRTATADFLAFLADKASHPIHYTTPAQISTWRDAVAKKSTPRTANNKLKILRSLFQTAWRDGLLTENPAAKVPVLKTAESNRRPFTVDELKTLLRVASSEWRGMVLAGLYTGQRLKDIASLTWANVDMERNEIRLSTSKTGRHQVLPIASPLRSYLAELPASDKPTAPLFPDAYEAVTTNIHAGILSRQFGELLASAGLAKVAENHYGVGKGRAAPRERNPLSFHSLRHTATSMLKAAGVSEAVARDIIGHDSAEISRHYTHVDEPSKRKAIAKLPDITALTSEKRQSA
ncbi:MAG TPA: site-specific integrase [Opitutaceae bacterium]|nr:site-specific integrase [Opitutaceae bacterium]